MKLTKYSEIIKTIDHSKPTYSKNTVENLLFIHKMEETGIMIKECLLDYKTLDNIAPDAFFR